MLEYNDVNLQRVSDIILRNLTPDLLPKKWVQRNSTNPTFGHCHTVAGCLYKVFGIKNVRMYRGFDGEIYHWWNVDKNGTRIDLTADQYYSINKVPPYDVGEKAGMLGFGYRQRVIELYNRVMSEL